MNFNDLDMIYEKIFSEGLDINESDFLDDSYNISDFKSNENYFEDLVKTIRQKDKPKYAFAFYIGFLNLVKKEEIRNLQDITKFKSYSYLKGSLKQYFKGHMNIDYGYYPIKPYHNYYSFVNEWRPRPFSISESFIKLLNWIYKDDRKFFYDLMFMEEFNYIFMSLFKGVIIKNFKVEEEYLHYECNDNFKFYIIFNYLVEPFTTVSELQFDFEAWKFNYNILKNIKLDLLIKIILDYIKSPRVSEILLDIVNILKKDSNIFYQIFCQLEINNIRELYNLFDILTKLDILSENQFNIFLEKLKNMFMKKYITIDLNDWDVFLSLLNQNELIQIKKLINSFKNDLIYVSELDKEIRYAKYLIDFNKSEKFDELLLSCENWIEKNECS